MNDRVKLIAAAATLAALAGCAETSASGGRTETGLSGTSEQFAAMEAPCIAQAERLTGQNKRDISVTNRLQTGGGPLLTLDAGGAAYSCRMESDGSVTVFSEYAN